MKLSDQPSLVNGVHIMEVQIDSMSPLFIKMHANYALVRSIKRNQEGEQEGYDIETHGKCSAYPNNWSERTIECLHALVASMEEDLLPRHFDIEKKEEVDEGTADRRTEEPAQV